MKTVKIILLILLFAAIVTACETDPAQQEIGQCQPTPYDEIGPFYRANAPERNKVGQGYVLSGQILSAKGCRPLPKSRIEFWLVNPEGEYDDAHRATVIADRKGRYRFASNRPTDYVGRLPHIHIKITAEGHEELITQHYPKEGENKATFDIVLEIAKK
ncbi:MAG: intradiol ring-cleavage dioxygenase [Proteobacteria bacterium]|nr:intradiol ring-cleavage dioxygenase [Pseudomonadota bacterium]MBU1739608.1 intradiol ring-cleavage dioxygenase [Pseudomonadota bacterium]